MSKIKIKAILKTPEEIHEYSGYGILNKNKITYIDNNIKTSIVFDNVISVTREANYQIKLFFANKKDLEGYYQNNYGIIKLKTKTKYLKNDNNYLKINYSLFHGKDKISDFEFILEYSIDT